MCFKEPVKILEGSVGCVPLDQKLWTVGYFVSKWNWGWGKSEVLRGVCGVSPTSSRWFQNFPISNPRWFGTLSIHTRLN